MSLLTNGRTTMTNIEKAVKFLSDTRVKGTVQMKMAFLKHKGLSDDEVIEALNIASGGAVVAAALS